MEAIGDVDKSTFDGVVGYKQLQEAPLQKGAGGPGVAGRGRGIQAGLCETEELGICSMIWWRGQT